MTTALPALEEIAANRCFAGWHRRYRHRSATLRCEMVFAVYLPPQAAGRSVPALYWLSGLTCSDENFMQKAGAMRLAAELGIALVAPDTSPRGAAGTGRPGRRLGFRSRRRFLRQRDAAPWAEHYRMHDYVVHELPELIEASLPIDRAAASAATRWAATARWSVRCATPAVIARCRPWRRSATRSPAPGGRRLLRAISAKIVRGWPAWDACELIERADERLPLLVDQGEADGFLRTQLQPDLLQQACAAVGHPLHLRCIRATTTATTSSPASSTITCAITPAAAALRPV
jgi:S-formylglutathione hydrolase